MNTPAAPLRIGIAGALGRMGRAVAAVLAGRDDARLVVAFDQPGTEGQRLGELTLGVMQDVAGCDVVIDFTPGDASATLAEFAARTGAPALVVGSTGWSEAADQRLRAASATAPIVRSGNYSLGVNILASSSRPPGGSDRATGTSRSSRRTTGARSTRRQGRR